jgi:predicted enzyme related to lactoylglutathione lyase
MAKIIGLGGVFLKSNNPEKLYKWYAKWLGLEIDDQPGVTFRYENLPSKSFSVLSFFSSSTDYFAPSRKEFMVNLVVDNLDQALQQIQEGGAEIVGQIENYDYGKFGWFIDPDGNKIELWEVAE